MQRTIKTLITAGTVAAVALGSAVAADAAIVTSQASLVNGQLTIVGSGAVPNSNVPGHGLAGQSRDLVDDLPANRRRWQRVTHYPGSVAGVVSARTSAPGRRPAGARP
jgi:hypothetical protein